METVVGVMVEEAAKAVAVMAEEAAMAVAMAAGAEKVEEVERVEMAERAVVMVETARPQHFLPS